MVWCSSVPWLFIVQTDVLFRPVGNTQADVKTQIVLVL